MPESFRSTGLVILSAYFTNGKVNQRSTPEGAEVKTENGNLRVSEGNQTRLNCRAVADSRRQSRIKTIRSTLTAHPLTAHRSRVQYVTIIQVVIVSGFHLFPFRTEKLSPAAPMVLHTRGRVGSRRFFRRKSPLEFPEDSFF